MAGDRRPPGHNGEPGVNGERGAEAGPDPADSVRVRPVRGAASPGLTPIRLPNSNLSGTEEEVAGGAAPRTRTRQLTPHVRVQPREPGEAAFPRAEPWPPAPAPEPQTPSPAPRSPSSDEAAQLQRALNDWLRHAPAPGVRAPLAPEKGAPAKVTQAKGAREKEGPDQTSPDSVDSTAASPPAGDPHREVLRVEARPGAVEQVGTVDWGGTGEPADRPAREEVQATPEPAPPSPPTPGEDLTPRLEPMYVGVTPFLARFLPRSAPQQLGLLGAFCPLDGYLGYLHGEHWSGYLQVGSGQLAAYALLHEGRVVAAATLGGSGEEALGELLTLYGQGAPLAAYPLPPVLAHLLSGVGVRAARPELGPDFTGVYADAEGALLYSRGEVVARVAATLPVEGAFPAPARPPALGLPRSLAGWAYQTYPLTLRGRDVDHPITGVYHEVRAKYGEAGADFVRALGRGQTPAEYAARSERALPELEKLIGEFTALGLLRSPET